MHTDGSRRAAKEQGGSPARASFRLRFCQPLPSGDGAEIRRLFANCGEVLAVLRFRTLWIIPIRVRTLVFKPSPPNMVGRTRHATPT